MNFCEYVNSARKKHGFCVYIFILYIDLNYVIYIYIYIKRIMVNRLPELNNQFLREKNIFP